MGGERTEWSPPSLSSPHRALVVAGGRRPFVGSETSRSSYRPLSYLTLSTRSLASAVSRRRTRISLDLLNTAMTALPTPSIFSHSYLRTRKKRLRKFWLPDNVETFSRSQKTCLRGYCLCSGMHMFDNGRWDT